MTKLLINGRFLCRRPTGVDRFATEILRIFDRWYAETAPEMDALNCEIAIPRRPLMHWQPKHLPLTEMGPLGGHGWEQATLSKRRDYDVLLSLCNTGPLLARNHIVAIHDVTPARVPESFSYAFRSLYRFLMPALGRTASRIITVSEFSRREIELYYSVLPAKLRVIDNSAEHVIRVAAEDVIIDRLKLRKQRFALAVATNAKHKNIAILADVAERLRDDDICIVLVGGANNKVFDKLSDASADRVIRTGYVSDGELRALYEHASSFVFPSFYEGFGIPPLEAMYLGCPVISSDAAALPEVLGDAALYVSPTDANAFYQAIRHVAQVSDLRDSMIERGYRRAAAYSWEGSARSLLAICEEVAETGRRA